MITEQERTALNVWIAEHVKGWERIEGAEAIADFEGRSESERAQADKYHCKRIWGKDGKKMACEECGSMPDFCGDMNLAFETVAGVATLTDGLFTMCARRGKVTATIRDHEGEGCSVTSEVEEPALALCLAIKRFKGVEA